MLFKFIAVVEFLANFIVLFKTFLWSLYLIYFSGSPSGKSCDLDFTHNSYNPIFSFMEVMIPVVIHGLITLVLLVVLGCSSLQPSSMASL